MVKLILVKDICGYGGMADASDSKSDGGDFVWVQVPLSAFIFFAILYSYNFAFFNFNTIKETKLWLTQ